MDQNVPTAEPTTPPVAPPKPPEPGGLVGLWRGWLRPFLVVMAVLFTFRSVVLDWNVVPSGSMKPTILEGDYIFVNKLAYDLKVPFTTQHLLSWGEPQRGDVVVFTPPGERDRYVKRVVGVPGDVLELRDNKLFVNGEPAAYEPLDPAVYRDLPPDSLAGGLFAREVVAGRGHPVRLEPDRRPTGSFAPLTVPPGHYFMMGDNRDDSKDSRSFKFVSRDRILGRVSVVAVSLDPQHGQSPRWQRFLKALSS
jgi:signal peptidase I